MTAMVGSPAKCSACGKRGKRVQNVPDDPAIVARFGLPRALACSGECMAAIRVARVPLAAGFGLGWVR